MGVRRLETRPARQHEPLSTAIASLCDRDMEGIVAKQANARYTPEATTWVKIKNRQYSQAIGRADFFDRRRV